MHQIVCGSLQDPLFRRDYAPSMFQLRYRVFHERLQWQVQCRDGFEIDEFDDPRSLYIENQAVFGPVLVEQGMGPAETNVLEAYAFVLRNALRFVSCFDTPMEQEEPRQRGPEAQ